MDKLADFINEKLSDYDIEYRVHATRRMFQRDIHEDEDEVELVIRIGTVIEQYDDDFPLPSVLINGCASTNRPLHLVVAVNRLEKKLVLVTAYEPDPIKWADNFSRRVE